MQMSLTDKGFHQWFSHTMPPNAKEIDAKVIDCLRISQSIHEFNYLFVITIETWGRQFIMNNFLLMQVHYAGRLKARQKDIIARRPRYDFVVCQNEPVSVTHLQITCCLNNFNISDGEIYSGAELTS